MVDFYNNGVCAVCSKVLFPYSKCEPGFYAAEESIGFPDCLRCPTGSYCPVGGDRVPPLPCPSGHWCPPNSFVAIPCGPGTVCTERRDYFVAGPGVVLGVLLFMFAIHFWKRKPKSISGLKLPLQQVERGGAEISRMNIQLRNLEVKLPSLRSNGKIILNSVSGDLNSGRLTAIMGGSGAGKTTLLTVLRGGLTPTSGEIKVNGKVTTSGLSKYKRIIGFVPQEDSSVDPYLTVSEALHLSAILRLPSGTPAKRRTEIVDGVLGVLRLTRERDMLVGFEGERGLSGGQRKRVSIGLELVAQPSCLLLDEPTSGLDSTTSLLVVEMLREIAAGGVNVIATIHQPSETVFNCFDDLVLMVPGGRIAYWGPAADGSPYLQKIGMVADPRVATPDLFLDFLSNRDDDGDASRLAQIVDEWSRSRLHAGISTAQTEIQNPPAHRVTPWLPIQSAVQLRRIALRLVRDVKSVGISCAVYAFTGTYLGMAFIEPKYTLPVPSSITKWCPATVAFMTDGQDWNQPCNPNWPSSEFQGLAAMYFCMGLGTVSAAFSVRTFSYDVEIFRRETRSGCNPLAIFLAKMISDGFQCLLFTLFFLSLYFLVAAPYGAFSEYFYLVYAFIFCNFGLGYIMSAFFSLQNASVLATLLACVFGVTSGLVFQRTPVWPFFFSEGLWRSEASIVINNANETDIKYIGTYADAQYGFEIKDSTIADDLKYIFIYAAGLRVIAFVSLLLWNRAKLK